MLIKYKLPNCHLIINYKFKCINPRKDFSVSFFFSKVIKKRQIFQVLRNISIKLIFFQATITEFNCMNIKKEFITCIENTI